MTELCLFGSGAVGRTAAAIYKKEGRKVAYFIDNDETKWGLTVLDIPVISLEQYCVMGEKYELVISCTVQYVNAIKKQLLEKSIYNFTVFDMTKLLQKERLISYSYKTENEDVILYHVLKNEPHIFYIDVGCNEPTVGSVTKLLYDKLGARGLNIDVEKDMIELTKSERPEDISLCIGVGESEGVARFCTQGEYGGLSTMVEDNIFLENKEYKEIEITTLKNICEQYVGADKEITFLKIDVEGMEQQVLKGANFKKYRPKLIIMESTLPCTDISNYFEWEKILIEAGYHMVYEHGVNRYYVSNECEYLDERFVPWPDMAANYCIFHADIMYCC